MTTETRSTRDDSGIWLTVAKGVLVLTILNLVVLYVAAGRLVQDHELEGLHGTSAIVLHCVTGALTLAFGMWALRGGGPWWPAVVAGLLFALSFLQANWGSGGNLALHVPGALVLAAGPLILAGWLFGRGRDEQVR